MWLTYTADKAIWVVAGILLTAGVWLMAGSNWLGALAFINGLGAIWFTVGSDKDKGYVEVIHQHKLSRREEGL